MTTLILYTIDDTCRVLGIHRSTLMRWVAEHKITACKLKLTAKHVYFWPAEVEAIRKARAFLAPHQTPHTLCTHPG
jgi:excisionase family DNA binding protein